MRIPTFAKTMIDESFFSRIHLNESLMQVKTKIYEAENHS